MNGNVLYLLRMWILAIVLLAFLIFSAISAVLRGDGIEVCALAFGALLVGSTMWWARRQRLAVYRETTPDRAFNFYANLAKRQKGNTNRALMVYSAAYAAILYGQFDRAREAMESVDWLSLPPVFRSYQAILQALLSLFEEHDPRSALQWMQRAESLAEVPGVFPGAKTAKLARASIAAACRIQLNEFEPTDIEKLEEAVRRLSGIGPALSAWALAAHYERIADSARSVECRNLVKRLTPHCVSLAGSPFAGSGR